MTRDQAIAFPKRVVYNLCKQRRTREILKTSTILHTAVRTAQVRARTAFPDFLDLERNLKGNYAIRGSTRLLRLALENRTNYCTVGDTVSVRVRAMDFMSSFVARFCKPRERRVRRVCACKHSTGSVLGSVALLADLYSSMKVIECTGSRTLPSRRKSKRRRAPQRRP
jgi:hypothetical protein